MGNLLVGEAATLGGQAEECKKNFTLPDAAGEHDK